MRRNKCLNVSMKRYMEIGSPWRVPVSKFKYWVAVPPFMTHEG